MSTRSLLTQALFNPRSVGTIAPSSAALAERMVAAIPHPNVGQIIEIGAGTGPVTRALVNHGVTPQQLLVVEMNRPLGLSLRQSFPHLDVAIADAQFIPFLLRDMGRPSTVHAVVSSLAFRSMPHHARAPILHAVNQVLEPGGVLVQFTYGWSSPITPEECQRHRWEHEKVGLVLKNLPPATIHRYWKR